MIKKKDFRTYQRRAVTRRSGYKVSGEKTGGECIILDSEALVTNNETVQFKFFRDNLRLVELFESNLGMIAFGGYVYTESKAKIRFVLEYGLDGKTLKFEKDISKPTISNDWNPIGFHKEISLDVGDELHDVYLTMEIITTVGSKLHFIGFDFDVVNFEYYKSIDAYHYFQQKTSMHVPHIYYLNTLLPFTEYLISSPEDFEPGPEIVLKGCNRCARYLPINIHNEVNTLSFSLHCKKKAPCTHPLFMSYKIDNYDDLTENILENSYIMNDEKRVKSYYGHQLECKACKKFFVNAALNPMRNSQQFREDGLRRRATEVLVNYLLDKELVHHEFRKKTKKEFSEHIWSKFGQRCFKCGKKLALDEMHLDHTMPLAFLYRLDESATCLCANHNSQKRDHFPIDYYTEDELKRLSSITGLGDEILHSKSANSVVVKLLRDNIEWFFDVFLMDKEYQKIRDERLTADKIYASLQRVIDSNINLIDEYYSKTGKYPTSITID